VRNEYSIFLAYGVLVFVVCGLGPLYTLQAASLVYRLVKWSPSVQLTRDGLSDNCSLLAGGVGLIRWEDMNDVFVTTISADRPNYFAKPNYVLIRLEDPHGIVPQSALLRRLQRIFPLVARARGDVLLPASMVSMTPGELFDTIRHAYLAEREHRHDLQRRRIAGLV
jgi:hypothetical protein